VRLLSERSPASDDTICRCSVNCNEYFWSVRQVYHLRGPKRLLKLLLRAVGLAIQTGNEDDGTKTNEAIFSRPGPSKPPCVPWLVVEILSSRQLEDQILRVRGHLRFKVARLPARVSNGSSKVAILRGSPVQAWVLHLPRALYQHANCKMTVSSHLMSCVRPCATSANEGGWLQAKDCIHPRQLG
jgi:hypothetical protein